MIPETESKKLIDGHIEIVCLPKQLNVQIPVPDVGKVSPFITAIEFMKAARIGRTKSDQLV